MAEQLIVWNGGSGGAGELERVRAAIHPQRSAWLELQPAIDLTECIERAIASGCRTVVAAGGDGTVNALVNALMRIDSQSRPSLAIIPLGTANDFAGTLGIPDDVVQSAELIDKPATPIDTIRMRGEGFERYFANVAAGGNSVRVSEQMTEEIKHRWGALAYLRGALGILADIQSYHIDAYCDDERLTDIDSWAVLACNGKTNAGRIQVAPLASPADGLLDLVIIRGGDATDILELAASNLLGNYLECDQVIFRQVKRFVLHSEPTMRFSIDGEVVNEEPVEFYVIPGAIRMHTGL